MRLYAIIVAGGSGTRLWPLSRKAMPKQVLPVLGDVSLLRATWKRLRKELPPSRILLITSPLIADHARRELPQLPEGNLLIEPVRRETGPALGLGAAVVAARDPRGVIVNVNSDAFIKDDAAWWRAIRKAARAAETKRRIALVGVRPTYPETGYGYIETGRSQGNGIFEVRAFREKPDPATAERYVTSGRHLWNPTLIVVPAETLLAAFKRHLPRSWAQLDVIRRAWNTPSRAKTLRSAFPKTETVSIDYGILEKERPMLLVPADFGWSDIGHWRAIHGALAKRPHDNVARGPHVSLDGTGNLLYSFTGKLIATAGIQDTVVIETEDAILVVPKTRAQDVKKLVEALEQRKMHRYL